MRTPRFHRERTSRRRRLSYANVVSTMALVFAMSGGAMAANHYLVTSTKQVSPKVLKALRGKTGKTGSGGLQGATGPQGPPGPAGKGGSDGSQGVEGKAGADGKPGADATRLWAVIANPTEGPSVTRGSGVLGTSRAGTGVTVVKFAQDVSQCSFQATVGSPHGGIYASPIELQVTTAFYEGGLPHDQVEVITRRAEALTNSIDFSVAAFC
jgi:hypothetical protein